MNRVIRTDVPGGCYGHQDLDKRVLRVMVFAL